MSQLVALPKSSVRVNEFCMTPTAGEIIDLCHYVDAHREIGLIVGDAGCGKSTALREYAKGKPHVHLITMSPGSGTRARTLTRILEDLRESQNRTFPSVEAIVRFVLKADQERKTFILDEAQFLNDQALQVIRSLHDELKIGVVLSGNGDLRGRWDKRKIVGFAALDSRIAIRRDYAGPGEEDIRDLCEHHDVTDPKAREILRRHAIGVGGLRRMVKIIEAAERVAGGKRSITEKDVREAVNIMGVRG